MKFDLSIVITCWNELYELLTLLYSFASNKGDDNLKVQFIIMHDTENSQIKRRCIDAFDEILKIKPNFYFEYHESKEHFGSWGHPLREKALKEHVKGEWLLWTNCDNYYVPNFLNNIMSNTGPNVGAIYFDFVNKKKKENNYYHFVTKFGINTCDMGSFIVRTSLAKEIGFSNRSYAADGVFMEALKINVAGKGMTINKVNSTMLIHN